MKVSIKEVLELLEVCEGGLYISDYETTKWFNKEKGNRFTHLRACKIQKWASKEGAGVEVKAWGNDELGNIIALMPNGGFKQFYMSESFIKNCEA